MELRKFIDSFPREDRMEIRRLFAVAHNVSEVTVRAWSNGGRKHPYNIEAIEVTELLTFGKVTRYDLRTDVFREKN